MLVAVVLGLLGLLVWAILTDRLLPAPASVTPASTGDQGVVGLFVLPDDGRGPVLSELAAARSSITLHIYLLTDEPILQALFEAVDRGVRVRVLLEEDPFGGVGSEAEIFAELSAGGVDVRWSDPTFRFSHVKTAVVDDRVAIVMNQNLTRSAFEQNREFFAITTIPAEVAQAAAIFDADWNRTGSHPDGPLVVSPTDSRRVLMDLVSTATNSIDIYAEVVRDGDIVAALAEALVRGVAVRLVVSSDSEEDDHGRFERGLLLQAGADIRFARGLYIHAKLILVDGERLFIGSQNLTATSLDDNREIGVIITDRAAIARASAVFAADFANGVREDRMVGARFDNQLLPPLGDTGDIDVIRAA